MVSLPTRDTATAAEAAKIFLDVCLRNGSGVPDVVVLDHDPKFRGAFFTAFAKGLGSALIVGSAYHKNTGAKVERVNGVVGDTLRAFVNGRGDDWDKCLPLVNFATNNSESAVAVGLTPFFIDRGEHPRLPLSHGLDGSLWKREPWFSPAPRPSTPQWPSEEDRSNGMNDDCDWPWSAARTE